MSDLQCCICRKTNGTSKVDDEIPGCPVDEKLFLAIYLGCYYVENLRISTKEEKSIAKGIIKYVTPRIEDMRLKVLDEFKTELLEVQQNEVKVIEHKK